MPCLIVRTVFYFVWQHQRGHGTAQILVRSKNYDKAKLIYKFCFIFFTKKAEAVDPELDKKEGLPAMYFEDQRLV